MEVNVDLRGGKEAARHEAHFAQLRKGADVAADQVVAVVDDAGGRHGVAAADAFLGRLEEDLELALQLILVVDEPAADLERDRGVRVMAAGMHEARVL